MSLVYVRGKKYRVAVEVSCVNKGNFRDPKLETEHFNYVEAC